MSSRITPWTLLARSSRGTAAVEFVMVMPVMLLLFVGCIDIGRALSSVELARSAMISSGNAASAVPCTTSGTSCVVQLSTSQLAQIMQGIQAQDTHGIWTSNTTANGLIMTVIQSNSSGALTITTQAKYPSTFTGTSQFGCKMGATPNGYGSISWEANDMFIVTELFYTYQPFSFAGSMLKATGLQSDYDQFVFRPRQPTTIASPAGTC